jgi:hypothetical protein
VTNNPSGSRRLIAELAFGQLYDEGARWRVGPWPVLPPAAAKEPGRMKASARSRVNVSTNMTMA